MTAVPERVLSWLYSSLKAEYQDPNRAYSDVAKSLSYYNSFSPRTEVYTYEDGSTALLVQLHGTLPVSFRGNVYRYPITVWVPHRYPKEPPILYVVPTHDMAVRPSQHVSMEGRVYHPYLAHWSSHWDKSSVLDFLLVLKDIFAKEPPLVSVNQQTRPSPQRYPNSYHHDALPPPRPPPPEELRRALSINTTPPSSLKQRAAPLLPPKPGIRAELSAASPSPVEQQSPPSTAQAPLVPPKVGHSNKEYQSPGNSGKSGWQIPDHSIQHRPPPLLPPQSEYNTTFPIPSQSSHVTIPEDRPTGADYGPQMLSDQANQYVRPQPPTGDGRWSYVTQQHLGQEASPRTPIHPQAYEAPTAKGNVPPIKPVQPLPDLLSGPLEVSLPSQSSSATNMPAPPIPPNPEKDALLTAISTALRSQLETTISQNNQAVSALEAQNGALQQGYYKIQAELSQLQQIDAMLGSNEKILRDAMVEADRVMDSIGQREKPNVDEVLVAPTVVGEQLYGLVADEKSITEAMFLLTRALDKGRISGDVFVKQTRTLAREQFLKKALIRKIAKGMGLATHDYR